MVLIPTERLSLGSTASYTTPIAPVPILRCSRKRPRVCSASAIADQLASAADARWVGAAKRRARTALRMGKAALAPGGGEAPAVLDRIPIIAPPTTAVQRSS